MIGRARILTFASSTVGSFFCTMLLMACSVYKSDGRKFLENQAYEYAGVAAAPYFKSCSQNSTHNDAAASEPSTWRQIQTESARVLLIERENSAGLQCEFEFPSPELKEQLSIDAMSFAELHFGPALSP